MAAPRMVVVAIGVIGVVAACGTADRGTTPSVAAWGSTSPGVATLSPTDGQSPSVAPSLPLRPVGGGDAACDVDLTISGVVAFHEQGAFRGLTRDPRDPESWTVFVQPHVTRALVDGDKVDITHTLQLIDFDAASPEAPLVVWRWYVVPPPPTPRPAPTAEPTGIAPIDTPPVTFFHYQWLATVPSDRTLPPGVSLAPAVGQAAFNSATSATFDLTFNIPEPSVDAPKGDIAASGSIACRGS